MLEHNFNDTISLFIFRSNARGMQYGIGTYIRELTRSLIQIPYIKVSSSFLIEISNIKSFL